MAIDTGTDVLALDDLPLSDALVSGAEGKAYELARRLLTPAGGLIDCGDEAEYESIDLRERLGGRLSKADEEPLREEVRGVLLEDSEVTALRFEVTIAAGAIVVNYDGETGDGPFRGVLSIDDVTGATLETQ